MPRKIVLNQNIPFLRRKIIVVLDVTVLQKASEVAGKIGSPEQLSDQISVLEQMATEMNGNGKNIIRGNCFLSVVI